VTLKQICNISLDGFSTGKRPHRCHLNRVWDVERPDSGCVVLIERFIKFQIDRFKLLDYLGTGGNGVKRKGINILFLLGKAGTAKLIANPTRATAERIFIFPPGVRAIVAKRPASGFSGSRNVRVARGRKKCLSERLLSDSQTNA
jgi:hypothetical protein